MEQVVTKYLKSLRVPVSKKYCEKLIRSHPDYPSLLSVSDTLGQLGIPHGVARMQKEHLEPLAFPYVLHMDKGGGEFLVVDGEQDLNSKPGLLNDWSGIVLQAEAPEEIEDDENVAYLAKERAGSFAVVLFVLSVLMMFTAGWVQSFSWPAILLVATAVTGAVLGYLLIAKDLGVKYGAIESFCNTDQSTNCDRVLHSDEAKIFGQFSLSDAVLSYFSAQLIVAGLLVPIAGNTVPLWWSLSATGILTLPVVAYSLWLQGTKFKTWCRLCLMVAGVLVVQAGLFGWMAASGLFGIDGGNLWAAGLVAGNFLAIGSLVFLLKTRIKEGNEAEQAEASANRVKFNPLVFSHLLLQQPQADCTPFEQEMMIGKSGAPIQITLAASFGCSLCGVAFSDGLQLVSMFSNTFRLVIRFRFFRISMTNPHPSKENMYLLGYWLRHISGKSREQTLTAKLIRDWYAFKDKNKFKSLYSFKWNNDEKKIAKVAVKHTKWIEDMRITQTPTFFLNGFKLPKNYSLKDLKMMTVVLMEHLQEVNQNKQKKVEFVSIIDTKDRHE
jgi:uncharacterized membrane protein